MDSGAWRLLMAYAGADSCNCWRWGVGNAEWIGVPLKDLLMEAGIKAEAEKDGMLTLQGDATRDSDLMSAQIERASGLVAATGDDSENVYIFTVGQRVERWVAYRGTGLEGGV